MKKNKKRNYKNYIIPIVLTFLILGIIGVYAGTTLSNNPNAYLTADNLTINGTGAYLQNGANFNGVSSGTADVVVCRGTSSWDDYYKSNKWLSGCDVVCKSTEGGCSDEISSAVNVSNRIIIINKGNYYIEKPVYFASNLTIEGYGSTLIANGSESIWSSGGTGVWGIFTFSTGNEISSPKQTVKNIIIKGIHFNCNNLSACIVLWNFDDVTFQDNDFTGNTSSYNGLVGYAGQYARHNVTNLNFIHNYFHDQTNINTTTLYATRFESSGATGGELSNVLFRDNTFERTNNIAIFFSSASIKMKNIDILNNNFYNLHGINTTAGGYGYAIPVHVGLNSASSGVISNLRVIGNRYTNDLLSLPNNYNAGFVFFYGVNNTIISDNIAIINSTSKQNDVTAFAPGRVTTPDYNVIISNNHIEGWRSFIDFDSTVNTQIYGNNIINCGSTPVCVGYQTQENVHIFNNNVINYNNPFFGNYGGSNNASILMDGSCDYCSIENNYITDYANPSNINYGIAFIGTQFANTSLKNNQINIVYGSILPYYNSTALTTIPIIRGNNFIADNYTVVNSTGGIHRCQTNDTTGGIYCI